jgi:uncharacterized protein (TIGR02231 family)
VSGASWTAQYDLRAKISTEAKAPSIVSLHYRASITQNTGEDWNNVELTLSTASPLLTSTIPTLQSWSIRENSPVLRFSKASRRAGSAAHSAAFFSPQMDSGGGPGGGIYPSASMAAPSPPPPIFNRIAAVASEGAINTTFTIEGQSSIPSDTSTNSQAHKVSIAVHSRNALLCVYDLTARLLPCTNRRLNSRLT